MSSKLQTPVKQTPVRSRTPSLSSTPKVASATATTSTPNRRLSTSIAKPVATPPRTAPRPTKRSSLMLGPSERRKLAEALDETAENEVQFVSYITDGLLTRLTGSTDLSKAKYLRISESDAKLKFIENLDKVPNLEELDMSDNEITQIRGLLPLKHLKVLNLSTNLITVIEGLDTMLRLEELDLSGNQIERIPVSISKIVSLKILKLHNNKLSTLRDISFLRPLKNLISLTIFANPMSEAEHSRTYSIYSLPTLATLDDSPVDDDERTAAHARFHREEVELLEQQLAKARTEIKSAKDEITKLESAHSGSKSSESRLGKDVSSLARRIEQLESESSAKTELLNKKSAELVGLCELLYEMKQELAFANIDKQFDMSAVDSIIGGDADNDPLISGMDDLDAQLDRLDMMDGTASSSNSGGGIYSPSMRLGGVDTLSPLPFAHTGIAQEFREMPYIGKTSATPSRSGSGNSRPGSRAPNGAIVVQSRKQLFENAAETQQAAHRYKTLKQQQDKLELEKQAMEATIAEETQKLESLRKAIEEKNQFVNEHPDDADSFTMHIEIETMRQKHALQSKLVQKMQEKKDELSKRIEPLAVESEQMKSLLGDLDEDTIASAHDFAMEIKALETQLEDRDETIQRMQALLSEKGLLSDLDKVVVLRTTPQGTGDQNLASSSSSSLGIVGSHTHSHSHTYTSEDILAKLREMEQNHVARVKRLILGFPRYPTESASQYWEADPTSVEEACHTLEQQITDAFGFSYGGKWLTSSVASLRDRISQLESHVEYLEHLKYTHFFNIEDGLEDDLAALSTISNSGSHGDIAASTSSQDIMFALPKTVEGPARAKASIDDGSDENNENGENDGSDESDDSSQDVNTPGQKGSGVTYGVRREKLAHSTLKQLWFLWRLLAMKMDTVRKAWENGAISATDMQEAMSSGEWKYWSGMGRLEFFFQHAMSHISVLEGQIEAMQSTLASPSSAVASTPNSDLSGTLSSERDDLVNEITQLSGDLAMKKADVVILKEELAELQKSKEEKADLSLALEQVKSEIKDIQSQKNIGNVELEYLKTQIAQHKATRDEVAELQQKFDKLHSAVEQANQARDELTFAKKEHARITIEIAGMQRLRDELESLKKDISNAKADLSSSASRNSKSTASNDTLKPTSQHGRAVSTTTSLAKPANANSSVSTQTASTVTLPTTPTKARSSTVSIVSPRKESISTTTTPVPIAMPVSPRKETAPASSSTPAKASTSSVAKKEPVAAAAPQTPTKKEVTSTVSSSSVSKPAAASNPAPTVTKAAPVPAATVQVQESKETISTQTDTSIPVSTMTESSATTPRTLTPSSSSGSLDNSASDPSVSDRLSLYRQREQEARKMKEQEKTKPKRSAPKRSWTVSETGGLARSSAGPENPRSPVVPSSSVSHLPTPSYAATMSPSSSVSSQPDASSSQPASEEPLPKEILPDDIRKERRKSQLPRGLQDFLKMTGGPQ